MMSPKRLRPEAEKERATASSPDSPPTEEAFVSSCTYCATLFSRQQNHCVFNKSSKRPCRSAFSDNVLQYTSVQECSSCASQCCCLSEAASCAVPLSVCQKRTAYSSPASCSLTPPARLHCCDTLKKSVAEAANIFRAPSTQRLCPILASETSELTLCTTPYRKRRQAPLPRFSSRCRTPLTKRYQLERSEPNILTAFPVIGVGTELVAHAVVDSLETALPEHIDTEWLVQTEALPFSRENINCSVFLAPSNVSSCAPTMLNAFKSFAEEVTKDSGKACFFSTTGPYRCDNYVLAPPHANAGGSEATVVESQNPVSHDCQNNMAHDSERLTSCSTLGGSSQTAVEERTVNGIAPEQPSRNNQFERTSNFEAEPPLALSSFEQSHSCASPSLSSSDSAPINLLEALSAFQVDEKIMHRIDHSKKFADGVFEYRFVVLPRTHPLFKMDNNYLMLLRQRILTEPEWRALGIRQTRGWAHIGYSPHESNVLLFQRALHTDPATGNASHCQDTRVQQRMKDIYSLQRDFPDSNDGFSNHYLRGTEENDDAHAMSLPRLGSMQSTSPEYDVQDGLPSSIHSDAAAPSSSFLNTRLGRTTIGRYLRIGARLGDAIASQSHVPFFDLPNEDMKVLEGAKQSSCLHKSSQEVTSPPIATQRIEFTRRVDALFARIHMPLFSS